MKNTVKNTVTSSIKAFAKLFEENGIEPETPEMSLAKSLAFYVLDKWQSESMLKTNPPMHFTNLYNANKTQALGHILIVLEHMGKVVGEGNEKVTIKA